jgi:phosphotransferase system HPr (HPr) family protein
MNGQPLRRKVIVTDPDGLHLRPLAAFAQLAAKYHSTVFVCKGDEKLDGRSAMQLLLLAAVQGTELTLEVTGDDAEEAIAVLGNLLSSNFSGAESADPPLPQKG